MSEEQLKAFLEAVKANAGLQGKLNAAADANAAAAIAKEAGFMISADELQKAHAIGEELTDEELEGVAGGVGYQSQKLIVRLILGIVGVSRRVRCGDLGCDCMAFLTFGCYFLYQHFLACPTESPWQNRGFYFFNIPQITKNALQNLTLSSSSAHNLEPLCLSK